MQKPLVALVAFEESDNLGIGYLSSVLTLAGYDTRIIDFSYEKEDILRILLRIKPVIIGFSVIFQYYIGKFAELIAFLRRNGVNCHFTAGGLYASLRYRELFKIIPSLDSVVRFEGENTLLQLVSCIYSESDWTEIKGIAFINKGKIVVNPLPPLETDLDRFPFPMRSPLTEYAFGKRSAPILAGRGCIYNCSFCNIRKYYQESSGPLKRIRKPEMVVNEMEFLFLKKKCSVFIFQDDDFPVKTANGSEWIKTFCKELINRKLNTKVMWKINCRPDEIEQESFSLMKANGLFLVFLGVEEGTNSGLRNLNKNMTVKRSLAGINDLKKLGIGFDFGFMLFNPQSTFSTMIENLEFLKQVCSDGYTPVTFLKMLPYFETDVESKLRKEGRLKGKPGFLDYDFNDELLNNFYNYVMNIFLEWLRYSDGLSNILKWARNYLSVFSHFYEMTPEVRSISSEVLKFTSQSNIFILDTMEELANKFETGKYDAKRSRELAVYRENVKEKHDQFKEQIVTLIKEVGRIAEYQRIVQLVRH